MLSANMLSLGCGLIVLILTSAMGSASLGVAQVSEATVSGTVIADHEVVPSATVMIENAGTKVARKVTTDAEGRYRASNLQPGEYEIRVEQAGFKTAIVRGLQLTVGQEAAVNLVLEEGRRDETIIERFDLTRGLRTAWMHGEWHTQVPFQIKTVRFQAEDGWILNGSLTLPEKVASTPIPGMVLLTEPGWQDRTVYEQKTTLQIATISGMVVLTLDPRGHGASRAPKDFNFFSPKEVEKLQLDVRAAVQFLASQKNVDPERIGVLAAGITGNYAVLEASENPKIRVLVLIAGNSASLSREALDFIQRRSDVPILFLTGKYNKDGVREMAQAYSLSQNRSSDLILGLNRVSYGASVFSGNSELGEQVSNWLTYNLKGLGKSTKVSFRSADGWMLYGNLRIPEGGSEDAKVPAVVFVHGAKQNESSDYSSVLDAVKRGLATLTFDWRGKNPDANPGKGIYAVDLPYAELDKLYLDVKAAIDLLATQKSVDSNRIGLVGATGGVDGIAEAAIGDPRVKALVMLSAYPQTSEFKQYISTHDIPILAVVSWNDFGKNAQSTRELYALSKSKFSQLIMYEDAPHGSEMRIAKPDLEPTIIQWLVERLEAEKKLGE